LTETIENKARTANIGLAIWRLKCFYEKFVQGSTAVILFNFCAKNPPHRQAESRYEQSRLQPNQSQPCQTINTT
jgi:hypothetical protein